jgi:hypothetical protein
MNMLGKTVQENSQNQSSVGIPSPPVLLSAGTGSESVAGSSGLDLDFLIGKAAKTRSSEKTGGPGGCQDGGDGDSGSGVGRSSALSTLLNGMVIYLPRIYFLTNV